MNRKLPVDHLLPQPTKTSITLDVLFVVGMFGLAFALFHIAP